MAGCRGRLAGSCFGTIEEEGAHYYFLSFLLVPISGKYWWTRKESVRERGRENYGGVVGHEYALGYCFFVLEIVLGQWVRKKVYYYGNCVWADILNHQIL